MNRNYCLLIVVFSFTQIIHAQTFQVSGRVLNSKLEPLPLASVQIKDFHLATLTAEDGSFHFEVEKGNYDFIVTMVGFHSQIISLTVTKNYTQNIILETDDKALSEVVIRSKMKDRSEEIIRQVIKNKDKIAAAAGAYSCDVYIRASQQDSLPPRKKRNLPGMDSIQSAEARKMNQMSMIEISMKYDFEREGRSKEERTGVIKRGDPQSLFYQTLTEGDFNLYNNLIKVPGLSKVPFLSPISYSGFSAYRYKMQAIKDSAGKKYYIINIKPRQLSNVTLEGQLAVLDSTWVIVDAFFTLPKYHVPEYDEFKVQQHYTFVNDTAWMIDAQQFNYYAKNGKGKLSGQTNVSYNNFQLQKAFPPKYFGAEVSGTAAEAYERDSSFWERSRTIPLTTQELRFIQYKDSVYRVTHTKAFLDSVDRKTNKVTWKKVVFTGQPIYNREREQNWELPSLLSFYQPIQFGGTRISPNVFYSRTYKSRKNISLYANLSYGVRNKDLNGNIRFIRLYNPFTRSFFRIEAQRDFQYIFNGDAWINMIKRNNIYLNNSIGIAHGTELLNGLFLFTDLDMAFRRSVAGYKINHTIDSLFPDLLDDNRAVAFQPYNALYGKVRLQYTPGQKYIRDAKEKIILGSNWPTFYTTWRKGIPGVFKSKVDFNYLEFGMEQDLKLGTLGIGKYNIKTGNFFSKKDLRLVDYQFQRRGDPLLFLNPNEAFQSLDSTFPVYKQFYQMHYLQEFNGAILNKIPLLKKLQLREVAGGGFLYAPERKLKYAELFGGIERVFKLPFYPLIKFKMGVYVIGSVANQFNNPVHFKIGFTTWNRRDNKWY